MPVECLGSRRPFLSDIGSLFMGDVALRAPLRYYSYSCSSSSARTISLANTLTLPLTLTITFNVMLNIWGTSAHLGHASLPLVAREILVAMV